MNPLAYDTILPILYFSISAWCFFLARKGLKTRELISKRGINGTGLENSVFLIWTQIIGICILGIGMLAYALIYASIMYQ
jgi:hypothetical protein